MQKWLIWVFPKWLSLNSVNSVNHDQIQKQYGYQRYYPSSNRYIASASNTKCIIITTSRYLFPVTTRNRYQSIDSSGKFFFTTTSRNITIVKCRMSLVTILVLEFVMIDWIRWIQRKSFSKNWNVMVYPETANRYTFPGIYVVVNQTVINREAPRTLWKCSSLSLEFFRKVFSFC